jgi:hypothetical protein
MLEALRPNSRDRRKVVRRSFGDKLTCSPLR